MRRLFDLGLGLGLMLVAPACVDYHDPPEGFEGPFTPPEVLNRALAAAHCRIDPLEDAEDLTVTATIRLVSGGVASDCGYVVRWKRGGMFAIEVTDGALAGQKIVSDGREIVAMNGSSVVNRSVPQDDTAITRFMNRLFPLQFFASRHGSEATLDENTSGPKGEAWIQLVKYDPGGRKHVLLLDAKSLEPRKERVFVTYDDGSLRPVGTWLEDWREDVRAGKVARVWRSYEGERLLEELRVLSLAWNTGLKDSAFTIPK